MRMKSLFNYFLKEKQDQKTQVPNLTPSTQELAQNLRLIQYEAQSAIDLMTGEMAEQFDRDDKKGRNREVLVSVYGRRKKMTTHSLELLNYQTIKAGIGIQCLLCEQPDKNIGVLYTIMSQGTTQYIHAMCVHYSQRFIINSQRKIENYEESMNEFSQTKCRLCSRLNASLECPGGCNTSYHLNCFMLRPYLGAVEEGPTIWCSEHKKKSRNLVHQANQRMEIDNAEQESVLLPIKKAPYMNLQELNLKNQLKDKREQEIKNVQEFITKLEQQFGSTVAGILTSSRFCNKQGE